MKRAFVLMMVLLLGAALAQGRLSFDEGFAKAALEGDAYEILSSELALERAESEDIREFAQQMIDAHRASSGRLMELRGNLGFDNEGFTTSTADGVKLGHLEQLEGADFENEYLVQQMMAHKAALALYQIAAAHASDADLMRFASEAAGDVAQHLATLHDLMATHGVSDPFGPDMIRSDMMDGDPMQEQTGDAFQTPEGEPDGEDADPAQVNGQDQPEDEQQEGDQQEEAEQQNNG